MANLIYSCLPGDIVNQREDHVIACLSHLSVSATQPLTFGAGAARIALSDSRFRFVTMIVIEVKESSIKIIVINRPASPVR